MRILSLALIMMVTGCHHTRDYAFRGVSQRLRSGESYFIDRQTDDYCEVAVGNDMEDHFAVTRWWRVWKSGRLEEMYVRGDWVQVEP